MKKFLLIAFLAFTSLYISYQKQKKIADAKMEKKPKQQYQSQIGL